MSPIYTRLWHRVLTFEPQTFTTSNPLPTPHISNPLQYPPEALKEPYKTHKHQRPCSCESLITSALPRRAIDIDHGAFTEVHNMASERAYSPGVFQRRMRRPRSSSSSDISAFTESSESSIDTDTGLSPARPRSSMGVRIASLSSDDEEIHQIKVSNKWYYVGISLTEIICQYHGRERLERLLYGMEDAEDQLDALKSTYPRKSSPREPSRAMEPLDDVAVQRMANFSFPPSQAQTPLAPPARTLTPLSSPNSLGAQLESHVESRTVAERFAEEVAAMETWVSENDLDRPRPESPDAYSLWLQEGERFRAQCLGTSNPNASTPMAQNGAFGWRWPRDHTGEPYWATASAQSPLTPLTPGTPMFMYPTDAPYPHPIAPPASTAPAHPYFMSAERWQSLPPFIRDRTPSTMFGPGASVCPPGLMPLPSPNLHLLAPVSNSPHYVRSCHLHPLLTLTQREGHNDASIQLSHPLPPFHHAAVHAANTSSTDPRGFPSSEHPPLIGPSAYRHRGTQPFNSPMGAPNPIAEPSPDAHAVRRCPWIPSAVWWRPFPRAVCLLLYADAAVICT